MELNLKMNIDNAAFEFDFEIEIARCLKKVMGDILLGKDSNVVSDFNGNVVGSWVISE